MDFLRIQIKTSLNIIWLDHLKFAAAPVFRDIFQKIQIVIKPISANQLRQKLYWRKGHFGFTSRTNFNSKSKSKHKCARTYAYTSIRTFFLNHFSRLFTPFEHPDVKISKKFFFVETKLSLCGSKLYTKYLKAPKIQFSKYSLSKMNFKKGSITLTEKNYWAYIYNYRYNSHLEVTIKG